VKLGSVPYLNARPLVEWFEHHQIPNLSLHYAVPSQLIAQLHAGEVDVAMASSFSVLEDPSLHLLSGLGVTAAGPVWSVRLLSRVPFTEIRTLALDVSSRSSNVLAQIILADGYGVRPRCVALPPDRDAMLAHADAAVLIGDIGIAAVGDGLHDLDLGQAWWELTGLPFYYAGWVARDRKAFDELRPLLFTACDYGLAHLEAIADAETLRLGLPRERCFRYLSEIMRYRTGDMEQAGLNEFRLRAATLGLIRTPNSV